MSSPRRKTMAATLNFDEILRTIQASNLNFHLEISPFSAVIHMKKSLTTNKSGISLFPPPAYSVLLEQEKCHNIVLSQKIVLLENEISTIRGGEYEESLVGRDEALERVAKLDIELKTAISDTLVKKEEILANDKKQTEQDLITKAEMNKEIYKLKEERKLLNVSSVKILITQVT